MMKLISTLCLVALALMGSPAHAQPTYVNADPSPYLMYSDSRALVIGAARYDDGAGWPSLAKVEGQVQRIAAALKEQGFAVETLLDPKSNDLSQTLRRFLLQRLDSNARLLVYYAGHGWSDGDAVGFIVPTDSPAEGNDNFIASLINMEEIVGWGRRSLAKHVLFVFDSCFSGSVFLVRRNLTASTSELYLNDIDRKGRQYLTAGGYREQVPDSNDFSDAFMAGIRGDADYNDDNIVTANELGPFIRDALIPIGNQHPQFGTDTRFDMKLGDMVFVPGETQTKIAYAAEASGPRNSALRGLGEPRPEADEAFKGVEVLYYQKTQDGNSVSKALDSKSIPYVVTRAILPGKFPVNTIACAQDVPIEALKQVTLTLIDGGVPVRRIATFRKPAEKPRRIEILSSTKEAAGKVPLDSDPLTRAQVEQLTSCPKLLENSSP